MNLDALKENKNIRADRFAMAAISYIFKAFSDNKRSIDYWPWSGKDAEYLEWEDSTGKTNDLYMAIHLLTEAINRVNNENTDSGEINDDPNNEKSNIFDKTTKEYKRRINQITTNLNNLNNSISITNKVSDKLQDTLDYYTSLQHK